MYVKAESIIVSKEGVLLNIILTGGGTAGHIYPAIAIAEICLRNIPKCKVLFIGRAGGGENAPILNGGYTLSEIDVSGVPRRISVGALKSIVKALSATSAAKKIIREFSADLIIGTGGYVCWPVLKAGQALNIPTLLHESNASPGLSARLLAGRCRDVMLGFEQAADKFAKRAKLSVVGNPVRSAFATIGRAQARRKLGISENRPVVVSFGGSLGAKVLNEAVIECMSGYKNIGAPIIHIHSSGKRYYEDSVVFARERGYTPRAARQSNRFQEATMLGIGHNEIECTLLPYIEDMPLWLSVADLAITRSGAITLAELAKVGVPAILIPSPNVSDNHQYENARCYAERGAAILIEEKELTAAGLYENISSLLHDKQRLKEMSEAIQSFSSTETDKRILNIIISTLQR